jgi:hypothetical protein
MNRPDPSPRRKIGKGNEATLHEEAGLLLEHRDLLEPIRHGGRTGSEMRGIKEEGSHKTCTCVGLFHRPPPSPCLTFAVESDRTGM